MMLPAAMWTMEMPITGMSATTAIMATALGAVMIEKHFKLDDNCVDAAYSLNPEQFRAMCDKVRAGWKAMN